MASPLEQADALTEVELRERIGALPHVFTGASCRYCAASRPQGGTYAGDCLERMRLAVATGRPSPPVRSELA